MNRQYSDTTRLLFQCHYYKFKDVSLLIKARSRENVRAIERAASRTLTPATYGDERLVFGPGQFAAGVRVQVPIK
jgi:hypothetical protein